MPIFHMRLKEVNLPTATEVVRAGIQCDKL